METQSITTIAKLAEQVQRVATNELELGIATWTAQYACEVTASALMNEYRETGDNYLDIVKSLNVLAEQLRTKLEE